MAIDLDGGTGLFDRLGRLGHVFNIVSKFFTSYDTDQLEKEVNDVILEYDGATSNAIRSCVDGIVEALQNFQLGPERFMSDLQAIAETTLVEMANADNTLSEKTVEAALIELIKQMRAGSETVDANEPTISTAAFGSNEGTAGVLASLTSPLGETRQCVFPEDILVTADSVSARGATLSVKGENTRADSGISVFWPDGSGASASLTMIDPSADGVLTNGDFETWTAGPTLGTWTAVTGTVAQESTNKQFGSYAGKITGDGSTLTQIRQDVSSLVQSQTVYVASIALKLSSVPAAGVLTIDLFDGTAVIQDDSGNNQSYSITLTSGVSTSAFTTFVTSFRLPSPLPSTIYFRVRLSTALSNTVILYLDSCCFGVEATELYDGGPFIAFVATDDKLAVGDYWTITVANDFRGTFQTLFWRLFNEPELMLPSATGGTETINDALLG